MPWRKFPWKLGTLASASGIGAFFDPGESRPHIYQNFPFSTFSYPARQAPFGFILKLFFARAQGPGDRVDGGTSANAVAAEVTRRIPPSNPFRLVTSAATTSGIGPPAGLILTAGRV